MIAYLVSAAVLIVVSLTDKNGQEDNRVRELKNAGAAKA